MKTYEQKLGELIAKKIKAIKYAYFTAQHKDIKQRKKDVYEIYINAINLIKAEEKAIPTWEVMEAQPVSEEFMQQVTKQAKEELALLGVKEPAKVEDFDFSKFITPEQQALIDSQAVYADGDANNTGSQDA